jgi:small-conductance mechanosensitive channel
VRRPSVRAATPEIASAPDEEALRARYESLDSASFIYRILGWAVIVGGIIVSIAAAFALLQVDENGDLPGATIAGAVAAFCFGSLGSLIVGVFLLATADLLRLFIDLEWNTRLTAWNLAVDEE